MQITFSLFICWWTFKLFLYTGCHYWCFGEHGHTVIYLKLWFCFFGDIPRSGIAGHIVFQFLISWGNSILFYTLYQFTFPSRVYKGSLFSISLRAFGIFCLSENRHPKRYCMVSRCGFGFTLYLMLRIFSCTCWPFVHLLWKNVYSRSLLSFNCVFCFLLLYGFLVYFG